MKNAESANRRSRKTLGRVLRKLTADIGPLAELDRLLDVRERLVTILDAIDQDDPDTARFYAAGPLEDFDCEMAS